ncbi:hypothetical protein ABTY61_32870 [Kitasatospora sp. NPDC096128]|uniref:hypothetical protein n=1 Tax=Kitasatospora sp. NPDC096128 TaxID=3155547 RepID=UPI00332499E0
MTRTFLTRALALATAPLLATGIALSTAGTAHADVGVVQVQFTGPNVSVLDEDTFDNLSAPQTDTNAIPQGATTATVTNLTDEPVTVSTAVGNEVQIPIGLSTPVGLSRAATFLSVVAPAGL